MPKILGWFDVPPVLPWEKESVAFLYESQKGPEYYSFPMTGLLPYNEPDPAELLDAPSPLWVAYLDPRGSIGRVDSKGDKTFVIDLPGSFEGYIEALPYSDRKEMRYVLRKNQDIEVIENRKDDVDQVWDEYIQKVRERSIAEGETPFTEEAERYVKRLFNSPSVHTLSFYLNGILYAVNISFRKGKTVYDSTCIRVRTEEVKSRGLGNLAVLKNIECAIRDGFQEYDMLMGDWGYKSKFAAQPRALKQYIKCTREFAEAYSIPLSDISVLL